MACRYSSGGVLLGLQQLFRNHQVILCIHSRPGPLSGFRDVDAFTVPERSKLFQVFRLLQWAWAHFSIAAQVADAVGVDSDMA